METDSYPEVLRDLRDMVADALQEFGIAPDVAAHAAHVVAERMRKDWGGQRPPYIPKAEEIELSARDLEIWQAFNGRNKHDVCRRFGISEQWLYKILKYMRRRESSRRQDDLFGAAPAPSSRREV